LAQVAVKVHETGAHDQSPGIDYPAIFRRGVFMPLADSNDPSVSDEQIADRVDPLGRVNDSAATNEQVAAPMPNVLRIHGLTLLSFP
jgi:hypothetical protein